MDNGHVLGIDIGTSMIKVFIGTLAMDGGVLIAGSGTMPTTGFTKGIITDFEALAMSIKQAVECAVVATSISVKNAYIGIGGIEINSLNSVGSIGLSIRDAITHEDINRLYQAAVLVGALDEDEVLHILPRNFVLDKQQQLDVPLQQKCAHLEVEAHLVTIPKIVMNKLIDAIEKLGINVIGVVANSVVAMQTLPAISTQKTLFMDIGAGTTELILYRGREIYFSTSMPLGGDYITSDIMKGFSISYNHAEEIKKYYGKLDKNLRGQNIILDCNDYGTTDKQFAYDFLYDIIESRIDEIISLIKDPLKSIALEEDIEMIFLTGGCGAMPSFADGVKKMFGVTVEVVTSNELPLEYVSPANVACYGVLTYAVNNIPDGQVVSNNNTWQSLLSRFKKLFNS